MSGKRFWIAILCAVNLLAISAAAQDEKNEIGFIIGRTFVSDQSIKEAIPDPVIHSGKGLSIEGEYAYRFWVTPIYSISGELAAMDNTKAKLNAGGYGFAVVPVSYTAFFITPAARVNLFPTNAVSPWVSFGAGFGHFSESKTLDYGGPNPATSSTGAVIEGGLGLDVRVWRKLSIRGEVRDFWSGEPNYPLAPTGRSRQHNYFVGGGAFWRF
jgi:opacity protein-like surface antigen